MIFDYLTQPLQRPKVNQSKNATKDKNGLNCQSCTMAALYQDHNSLICFSNETLLFIYFSINNKSFLNDQVHSSLIKTLSLHTYPVQVSQLTSIEEVFIAFT